MRDDAYVYMYVMVLHLCRNVMGASMKQSM